MEMGQQEYRADSQDIGEIRGQEFTCDSSDKRKEAAGWQGRVRDDNLLTKARSEEKDGEYSDYSKGKGAMNVGVIGGTGGLNIGVLKAGNRSCQASSDHDGYSWEEE